MVKENKKDEYIKSIFVWNQFLFWWGLSFIILGFIYTLLMMVFGLLIAFQILEYSGIILFIVGLVWNKLS